MKRRFAPIDPGDLATPAANIPAAPVRPRRRSHAEADLVAIVAAPLAGYINGANLRIDGGSTAVV